MSEAKSSMINQWPRNLIMAIFGSEKIINYINTHKLEETLGELPEGEYLILRYKNGLTVKEVGNSLGVTHSKARCRIEKGMRKLAHPSRIQKFCEK